MSEVKRKRKPKAPAPPTSMGYDQLAAHLGVSRRQVIRYVVAGQLPRPEIIRKVAVWTGDALTAAMSGPGLPLSWEYEPSAREQARTSTIAAKLSAKKGKRPSSTTRKRSVKAVTEAQS